MRAEPRCANCGALVSEEAEWCGQCYAPLRAEAAAAGSQVETPPSVAGVEASTPAAPSASEGVGPVRARDGEPAWPCPACGNRNPLELDACATCGTPFARLLREPEKEVEVAPGTALLWSLAFPGLGHLRCRRGLEGLARGILFVWTAGTAAVLLSGGAGKTGPLSLLFLVAAGGLYGLTAVDAFRLASGEPPAVSSRTLLWAVAGLVLVSVAVATIIAVGAFGAR